MTRAGNDVYELNLATSGKLQLRAKGLLARGTSDEVFEACVLLHEAARVRRRAASALSDCPPATTLSSFAEECWCYIEGRDPPRAARVWGDVLRAQQDVDKLTARAILSRVAPRFEASQREFASAVGSSPTLLAVGQSGSLTLSPAERTRTRNELQSLLAKFPGMASLWWVQYRLAEADDRGSDAWDALVRARRLEPDNPRFLAMSLLVAASVLPRAEADNHLAPIRDAFDRSGAEVCLMYAFSEIALARSAPPSERKRRWQRALEAVQSGLAQVESRSLRRNLKAAQMLLQALLAGRTPTMDILYLAGLGELAVAAEPSADVADLLTASVRLYPSNDSVLLAS